MRERIGPSGRSALHLLACCPRIPTDVVAVLLRLRHARSAAQLLLRLRAAGLVQYETVRPGPLVGSHLVRLWTLTATGKAIVSARGLAPLSETQRHRPYGQSARKHDAARQRDVPMLIVVYRMLAGVVRRWDRPMCVEAWEHPWIRTLAQGESSRSRHVRLPAAAALIPEDVDWDSERPIGMLLLPDVGTSPVASYGPALLRLIELRQSTETDERDEPLLIVGVAGAAASDARAAAWHSLLQRLVRRVGERPLRAQVVGWPAVLASGANGGCNVSDQTDQLLGLAARHPLLTRRQLAILLGASEGRVGRLVVQLTALDWVRTLQSGKEPPDSHARIAGGQRRVSLVELTPAGRREAARRLLLPAAVATRHHGLLGKPASSRPFVWHLAHTLGTNAIFVAFVSAARQRTQSGCDDALEEWRSAAACARGRFRPDGYGCYRRGGARFGFFMEFDRGTEKSTEYAAKLVAYYRYRACMEARREYDGFPSLLVVTTRDAAEARFAYQAYLAQQRHEAAPLSIFLTTTSRIDACPDGVLGAIWRSTATPWAEEPERACWLPRVPTLTRHFEDRSTVRSKPC